MELELGVLHFISEINCNDKQLLARQSSLKEMKLYDSLSFTVRANKAVFKKKKKKKLSPSDAAANEKHADIDSRGASWSLQSVGRLQPVGSAALPAAGGLQSSGLSDRGGSR